MTNNNTEPKVVRFIVTQCVLQYAKKEHSVLLLVFAVAPPVADPTPLLCDRLPAPHLMVQTPAMA